MKPPIDTLTLSLVMFSAISGAVSALAFTQTFAIREKLCPLTLQTPLRDSPSAGWSMDRCNTYSRKPRSHILLNQMRMTSASGATASETYTFIGTELRGAAMKLHTKAQAPKEGQAPAPKSNVSSRELTQADYLHFLLDSKAVYEALEDIVEEYPELSQFRNTGLERTKGLDIDIQWMVEEFGIPKPEVGAPGLNYAAELRRIVASSIPAFMCHYYNFYFAHTAGGRMIGKKMSNLLLKKKTLKFYEVRF
uniref:Heme oxygenase n=1 Tax=Corethron hystrix TaxID=216773 RepID=A0A7S1BBR9_9STRA|mmetsp:Transcript_20182/g.45737  ORF Transcript_20182/g.45737 Transcript_20182/m.45737 type:complete len:250 (+) Transcript_20182:180-929(+)